MYPQFWSEFVFCGKVLTAALTFTGVTLAALKWVVPKIPFVGKVIDTNNNVHLLMTNHLPHIQQSLTAQDKVLEGIKSDVGHLGQRLEDTRSSMHTLGDSFIRHLEQASKETISKKRGK